MNVIYGLVRVDDGLRNSPLHDRGYVVAQLEESSCYGKREEHDGYRLPRRAKTIGQLDLIEGK